MEQAKRPSSSAEIVVVISNRPGVQGLKRASLAGIQTRVIKEATFTFPEHYSSGAVYGEAG